MSAISKDALIQACADAYKTASGESGVKAGELAEKIMALTAGGGASNLYIGEYTPTEDTSNINVTHNLETTDILLAAIFAESFEGVELTANVAAGNVFMKTNYPQYNITVGNNMVANLTYFYGTNYVRIANTSNSSFPEIVDANNIIFKATVNFRAGVTYSVVVIRDEGVSV